MKQKILNFITQRKVIVTAMVVAIVYTAFMTVGVIMRNLELKQEIAKTKEEIEVLRLENESLRHNIQYYKTDAYIEKVLREELGYAQPGETVLVFPDEEKPLDSARDREQQEELSFMEQREANFNAWLSFLFKE